MRCFRLLVTVLAALLLVACQPSAPQTIPTAAQLPTTTPQPTLLPTEEAFFTPTPSGEAAPSGETGGAGEATASPTEAGGSAPEGFASPTPEGEGALGAASTDGCGEADFQAVLAGQDVNALRADLDAFVERLRAAAGTLGAWSLDTAPDPLQGAALPGELPLARLRYQTADGQEAIFLVSLAPGAAGDFLRGCIASEGFYRRGDLPDNTVIAVEPLDLGDVGALATFTVPTSPEIAAADMGNITTHLAVVLAGDRYMQYVSSEPFAGTPTPQEDALALMGALVDAARGL